MTDNDGFVKVPSDEEEERMRKVAEESQRKREAARKKREMEEAMKKRERIPSSAEVVEVVLLPIKIMSSHPDNLAWKRTTFVWDED
ncbi:hypothetical protein BKA65DRAFT_557427 [Rhexocercosporidium sp. MPI-PUGE-AT-0058]|nr:hypothetical protein BKA65DRAFT_557427 [Rhexocercosporidium sp. MPI-PUGE-AT-0058]